MTVSAHDVARELRELLPTSGVMKVHKLLYFCQGWHLAWYGEPLFVEPIEAWENGPVVSDVWHDEHNERQPPTPEALSSSHLLVLDYVVGSYGTLTGRELADLTHFEGPWRNAWTRAPNTIIADEDVQTHFAEAERIDPDADRAANADEIQAMARQAAKAVPAAGPRTDETDEIRAWLVDQTR